MTMTRRCPGRCKCPWKQKLSRPCHRQRLHSVPAIGKRIQTGLWFRLVCVLLPTFATQSDSKQAQQQVSNEDENLKQAIEASLAVPEDNYENPELSDMVRIDGRLVKSPLYISIFLILPTSTDLLLCAPILLLLYMLHWRVPLFHCILSS